MNVSKATLLSWLISLGMTGTVIAITSLLHLQLIAVFTIGIITGILSGLFAHWYYSSQIDE